ncbi:restriction endonuclease subunit S [Methyloversatilis discipulorum]|uniref:restriction endonuclease subunit S n=1 Tax=Methyloversatilis discipulorum TaxID=1119528 RepID=UPI003AF85E53
MSALLTGNLPLIADAPDGIRKLRGLILELAVRGKLVPQDPNDEPASELLKQLAAEKAQLVREGKIKKDNLSPPKHTKLPPFTLPLGWAWARLADTVAVVTDGDHQPPPKTDSGIPFLVIGDLNTGRVTFNGCRFVSAIYFEGLDWSKRPTAGDILYTVTGSFGIPIPVIEKSPFCVQRHVAILKAATSSPVAYLLPYMQSLSAKAFAETIATGTAQKTVPLSGLREMPIALPPVAEQHRIVAKVNELMALCDRLEAEQADAESAHARLVDALLAALTRSTDAADFAANWQRLAAHFDTLFTTEAAIDALKQTVLQLAVMGKLVPQDPNDEPAIELLHWITVERSELEAAGKIRKSKPLQAIEDAAQPFPLPPNWAWARLGEVTLESGAGWSPNCESRRRENDEWGVLKVSAVSWGIFDPDENKALPSNLQPRPDCEVVQGDFLVSRANTAELVARSVWVESCPQRLMLSDKIVRLKLSQYMNGQFVNLANTCAHARSYYAAVAGGTSSSMKNVSREQILNLAIPLPPIAEQHRIVARVNELMALCDRLKADLARARQRQATLADALIAAALKAA